MTEKSNNNDKGRLVEQPLEKELDPAMKYLSGALKSAFAALKIIMVVLVLIFLSSGIRIVGSDEQALVLMFGRIRGLGEQRVLGPGLKFLFPYPVHEIIKIPVEKKINLRVDSFWYYQSLEDTLPDGKIDRSRIRPALNPVRDGYCIVRNERQGDTNAGGNDYNIVHCKWQLTYKINDPELFFRNVYVKDIKPGESYFEVIKESITPLLKSLIEDAVTTAMVNYTIDQALRSQDRIPNQVEKFLQEKLDTIQSGIRVISVQMDNVTWPRQVDNVFLNSIRARQESDRIVEQARADAEKLLNETAGSVATELIAALEDENTPAEKLEFLWSRLAGKAQERINQAMAYRTRVVENADASAKYLKQLLPEYRKRPKLVVQQIYQDAIQYALENADEKIIIQPGESAKSRELRILINRDPAIKKQSVQQR